MHFCSEFIVTVLFVAALLCLTVFFAWKKHKPLLILSSFVSGVFFLTLVFTAAPRVGYGYIPFVAKGDLTNYLEEGGLYNAQPAWVPVGNEVILFVKKVDAKEDVRVFRMRFDALPPDHFTIKNGELVALKWS